MARGRDFLFPVNKQIVLHNLKQEKSAMCWEAAGSEAPSPEAKRREENRASHDIDTRKVLVGWGSVEVDFCKKCQAQGRELGDKPCPSPKSAQVAETGKEIDSRPRDWSW